MYKNYDIPNKIKQSAQCCIYCGRSFKNRVNLDKHTNLCELVYKTTKNRKPFIIEDEETLDIPSQKKIYKMLLLLGQKYVKLEEKVNEMNKFIVKKKKKINVLEWLNTNLKPEFVFEVLIDKILVTEEDIDYLFKNTIYDTYNNIFSKNLYLFKKNEISSPIFAFIQKTNKLYIYDLKKDDFNNNTNNNNTNNNNTNNNNTNNTSNPIWHEISKEVLIKFLYMVQNKISRQLFLWKQKRNTQIKIDDDLAIEYNKTIIKLMGIDFKQDITFHKLNSLIYKNMKTDIKEVLEYEFEF